MNKLLGVSDLQGALFGYTGTRLCEVELLRECAREGDGAITRNSSILVTRFQ